MSSLGVVETLVRVLVSLFVYFASLVVQLPRDVAESRSTNLSTNLAPDRRGLASARSA